MNYLGYNTLPNEKEKCSMEKLRFFMDITYKHNHRVIKSIKVLFISKFKNKI